MTHEIRLYGPIGGFFGFTAAEIMEGIPEGTKDITLRIHSPGGSVGEGLAIYHALVDHPAKVRTVVDGYAASSASFVMLAGDVREVHRNSIVYLHNPWAAAEGNAKELRKIAEGLDVHAAAILDIYEQRTGMDEDELKEMMEETAFFRGVDAKENGFATAVLDDPEAEAQIAAMMTFENIAAKESAKMSRQKTRKEIEGDYEARVAELDATTDELASARAERDELKAEQGKAVEAACSGLNDQIADKNAALEALTGQLAEVAGRIDDLQGQLDAANVVIGESNARVEAVIAERDAETAKVKALETRLSQPAFADAQLADAIEAPAAQLDAEADAAEVQARADVEAAKEADAPTYAKWQTIKDAGEKRAYYLAHRDAIIASQDADANTDDDK